MKKHLFKKHWAGLVLMLCLLVAVPAAWAQNVIFVKSGVTDGETITVGSETGKAYNTVRAAVDNASVGDIVKLTENVTEEGTKGNPYGVCVAIIDRITIDGDNHSITGTGMSGSYSSVFYFKGGTIKNFSKITGGFRTIFSGGGFTADTYIDNCVIDAGSGAYPFNTDAANINYSVTITNCEINGWCSYTGDFKSFTISNTTFGQGTSGYAYFRPYSPTLLSDVTFDNSGSEGYAVDASQDRIVFNNCDVAGTTVTTENITTLLGSSSINKAVIAEGTYSADAEGRITGGIYGGNLDQLNQILAPGYAAMPLGTTPETYQVEPVYYVHFNAGGGTGTHGDSIVLRSNPTFTVPANTQFSYGTYAFLNWNSKTYGAGTDIAVNSTMNLTSDTTLYAEWDLNFVAKIGDNTYGTLQAALDDAHATMSGDKTIELVADITGYSIVHQKAGLNLTIEGHDHTLAGQIIIDGNGRAAGTETLTIQNIAFNDDGSHFHSGTDGFIMVPSTKTTGTDYYTGAYNYAHNITISNCSLTSTSSSLNVVGIKATSGATCYKLKVNNVTCDNLHSLAQLTATEGALIDNCSATNTGSFVNVAGGSGIDTISNCTYIGVDPNDGYAVRELSNSGVEIYLINNTFEANNVLQLGKNSGSDASGHINVESGTYKGNLANTQSAAGTATFVFTGGTFNQPVATVQSYCAEGYMAIDEDPEPGYCTVKKMYVVTFDNNGGSGTMDPASVNPGTGAFVVPACTFTNGDWAFDKWNTKADGTGTDLVENDPMTLTSDTTLYAQWRGVAKIGDTHYTTLNAAAAAVPVGTPTTIEILTNLNFYDISGSNLTDKTITFTGVATDTLTLTNAAHAQTAAYGADLTFENITLENDMTSDVYRGIIHLNKFTINNCEVIGFMMGYAETFICNNCTFTKTGKYHMWTYGSNCTFNSCTFNSTGNSDCKAINIYKEGSLSQPFRVVTFNNCAFNSTPAVTTLDNSAIQINSALCCFVVNINNCTVNGYINNSSSIPGYENLVNNKSTSVATTLNIDGTQILKQGSCEAIAMIGATYYSSIQEAVDYANANLTGDVTIDLVANTSEIVKILQKDGISITLNGNDSTLTGQIFISNRQGDPYPAYTGTYTESNTVTINNLNMKYDPSYFEGTSDEDGLIYFCKNCAFGNVLNYSHNVTISNCDFDADGSNQNVYGISSRAGSVFNLNIDNCTAKNAAGLATLQSAPQFEVTNCSTEDVKYGIRIVNNDGPMTVTGNNFDADEVGILVTGMTTGAVINFAEDTVNAPKAFELASSCTSGTLDITSGMYIGDINDNATSDFFNISGGTYSEDVTGEPCAEGYAAFANGTTPETWTVTKAWFLRYDPNGGTGHMDSSYVKQEASADHNVTLKDNEFQNGFNAFTTWNTKADGMGDNHNAGTTMEITCDTVVYAQWEPAKVMNVTKYMGYLTVKAAAAAADAGDTLELLMDLTEPNEVAVFANPVVLDLKGKTLTVQAAEGLTSTTADTVKIVNGTIESAADDVIYANGGIILLGENLTVNTTSSAVKVDGGGALDVNGANIYAQNLATQKAVVYADGTGSTVTLKAGVISGVKAEYTVKATRGASFVTNVANDADATVYNDGQHTAGSINVAIECGATAEFNGGTFTSESKANVLAVQAGDDYLSDAHQATSAVINGGVFNGGNRNIGYVGANGSSQPCTLTINDGVFSQPNTSQVGLVAAKNGTLIINDGSINSTNHAVYVWENSGAATINGGSVTSQNGAGVYCNNGTVTITDSAIVKGKTYGVNLVAGTVTINNDTVSATEIVRPIVVGETKAVYCADAATLNINGGIFSDNVADVNDNTLTPTYTGTYPANYLAEGLGTMIIEDATNSIRTDKYMWQVEPMDTVKISGSTYTFYYLGTEFVVPTAADDPGFTAMKGTENVTAQVTLKTGYEVKAQGTNAGEYPMNLNAGWFKAVDQPNVGPFVFTISEDGKLNINKRKLDLTFDNGSYDTTMSFYNGHVFTVDYTHLVEVDHGPITPTDHGFGLVNGDAITGGKFTTNDSVAGTYPVKVASFTLNPDEFEAVMSDFAIENSGTSVIQNYTPMFGQTGTQLNLIIAQRPLTITVEGTKPYDGKTFGYISSSFPKHGDDGITITGETPIYADGDTLTAYTLMKGTEVFADTCPGIYAVTVDPASVVITNADNRDVTTSYVITIVDGNDTITTFYNCGAGYDVVYEGVTYHTVVIGSQCWMTENLRADKGTNKIYGDESTNETKFGRLYTWYTAAGSASESDADVSNVETEPCMGDFIQGMCPDGWALPSSADFTELRSVVTNDLLRDPSNEYWVEGKQGVAAGNTGFQSRGAGHYTNRYESLLTETYYWTSDAKLYLGGGTPSIYSKCACDEYHCTTLTFMDFPKDQFKSVRCIRKKLNP